MQMRINFVDKNNSRILGTHPSFVETPDNIEDQSSDSTIPVAHFLQCVSASVSLHPKTIGIDVFNPEIVRQQTVVQKTKSGVPQAARAFPALESTKMLIHQPLNPLDQRGLFAEEALHFANLRGATTIKPAERTVTDTEQPISVM